ncbi:MAG: hypothetical protein WC309_01300 [Candidatus Paceibacterota bacterium]|jgi:hypothetical protein
METEFEQMKSKAEERANKKKAQIVIRIVQDYPESELFRDQFSIGYISFLNNGSKKVMRLRSTDFKKWVSYQFWLNKGETLGSEVINSVINVLEGFSNFHKDSKQHHLDVRISQNELGFWYDIGNSQAVLIDRDHWEIVKNPPILFKHLDHQKTQVEPMPGGDINDLLKFTNLKTEGSKLLFLISIVASFIPNFPHPVLCLHGAQGSGKTTISQISKELIDPSSIGTLTAPRDINEFVQLASHHWFIPLDNISRLPILLSDLICRVVTGAGFSKRELYSDDSDIIYSFKHVVCLNGINLAPEKADLLDRSIILELKRLDSFGGEKQLWKDFNIAKPKILGAIFDIIKNSIDFTVEEDISDYRMSDFVAWGCKIAKAMGRTEKEFLTAYKCNLGLQHGFALDSSPIGQALLYFMKGKKEWSGTASELLVEFNRMINLGDIIIDTKSRLWPKDPAWVSKRITEVLPNLSFKGIQVMLRQTGSRSIDIKNINYHGDPAQE